VEKVKAERSARGFDARVARVLVDMIPGRHHRPDESERVALQETRAVSRLAAAHRRRRVVHDCPRRAGRGPADAAASRLLGQTRRTGSAALAVSGKGRVAF